MLPSKSERLMTCALRRFWRSRKHFPNFSELGIHIFPTYNVMIMGIIPTYNPGSMMPKVLKRSFDELYEVADSQSGYFTARQALSAGYSDRMQTYHVQAGDWFREWRGIYRLRYYPNPRPDDLMVWYLWSCNREGKPQGVYSHDTALELLELSTWTSARIHMIVPKDFRRSKIPPALHLHYADLRQFETTVIRQVPVTKPIRTILDLNAEQKIQHHHLIEAMQDARKTGLINPNELNSEWLTDEEKRTLRAIDSEAAKYKPEA